MWTPTPLLECARQTREALREVKRHCADPRGEALADAGAAARELLSEFATLRRDMPRSHGTLRSVAGRWHEVAVDALWYRMAAFDTAEQIAFEAMTRIVAGEWGRAEAVALRDSVEDARVQNDYDFRDVRQVVLQLGDGFNAAQQGQPMNRSKPAAAAPLTIKDQADFRWLLCSEMRLLRVQAALVGLTVRSSSGARNYLPWLAETLRRLDSPLPVAELEFIAALWRERRGPFTDGPAQEFILVEPLPRRRRSTWWWRRHSVACCPFNG